MPESNSCNGKPIYNVGSNYLYNAGSAWVICSEYHKNNKLCQHGLVLLDWRL